MSQTFTLTITMGNDAMRSNADVAEALSQVSDRIADGGFQARQGIRDINGNTVGRWEVFTTVDAQGPDCTVDCAEYGCAGPGGWTHATSTGDWKDRAIAEARKAGLDR